MARLRKTWSLFYKDKGLLLSFCLLFLGVNGALLRAFQFVSVEDPLGEVSVLIRAFRLSPICLAVFTFLSYEFFNQCRFYWVGECLGTRGRAKLQKAQFSLLLLLDMALSLVVFLYSTASYVYLQNTHPAFFFQLILYAILDFFLVYLIGILLGWLAALTCKRLTAYLLLTAFLLTLGPFFRYLFVNFTFGRVEPLYGVEALFDLTETIEFSPNLHFGFSVLPYRFALAFLWVFGLSTLLAYKLMQGQRPRQKVLCTLLAALFTGSVVAYALPASKTIMNHDPAQALEHDYHYYVKSGHAQREEAATFAVLSYNLEMKVGSQLTVAARLQVSKDLPEYRFTLYHGYTVQKVLDQRGESLPFAQEGDYLQVKGGGQVSQLTIVYKGNSPKFYSNLQGIYLPGYFPYYPVAGYKTIYDAERMQFSVTTLGRPVDFQVHIRAGQKVFSNLQETTKNTFTGKTTGLTLLSGLVEETTYRGITVVYPYLDHTQYKEEFLSKEVDLFLAENGPALKKLMILPNINQQNEAIFNDYMTSGNLNRFSELYKQAKRAPAKEKLATLYQVYQDKKAFFYDMVEDERSSSMPERSKFALLLSQKIEEVGEETALRQVETYLNDSEDTRSIYEFLVQMG